MHFSKWRGRLMTVQTKEKIIQNGTKEHHHRLMLLNNGRLSLLCQWRFAFGHLIHQKDPSLKDPGVNSSDIIDTRNRIDSLLTDIQALTHQMKVGHWVESMAWLGPWLNYQEFLTQFQNYESSQIGTGLMEKHSNRRSYKLNFSIILLNFCN